MAGYWKNPTATAETVRDGWLHTGDMGYVSEDDFLYVLGRFKKPADRLGRGKYSPEGMEEAIVDKSPYIDQIIIHNNQSPFTGAIVVPNREALRRELEARRVPKGSVPPLPPRFSVPRSTVTGPAGSMPGVPRTVAAGRTGHCRRSVHRAERTGEQHDEGRARQGRGALPQPDRLPLHPWWAAG